LTTLLDSSFALIASPFSEAARELGSLAFYSLLKIVALIAIPVAIIGALVEFIQAGPVMTIEKIKPKAENLNPAQGFKRVFSMNNLMELIKSIVKTLIIVAIAWLSIQFIIPHLPNLIHSTPGHVGDAFLSVTKKIFMWVIATFVLVSALDAAWQRFSFLKKMRMSMRDIKQEMKESEGDPHIKGQRQQVQHEWTQGSAARSTADAHVLVVNPTHIAVAIAYDKASCPIPTVVALGHDDDALRLRAVAQDAGVPVLRNVPLARQLDADVKIGQPVPGELFDILAIVILWAQEVHDEIAARQNPHARPAANRRKKRTTPPGEDLTRYPQDLRNKRSPFWRYVSRRERSR
jgi:flagellar biosynthesis protein FlhB